MNTFLSLFKKDLNQTTTENGAIALHSTSSGLTDLFATIGALRERSEHAISHEFIKAFHEDPLLATKMAFYARNIRGGLGERRTFRIILSYLATTHPEIVTKNLDAIALFGRYDDFYTLIDTPVEDRMWQYLSLQLQEDLRHFEANEPISLLAKWLKSVNASNLETKKLGKLTAKKLGFTEKTYRQTLAKLRNYLSITEVHMTSGNWSSIVYSSVPSRAMSIYRNAFRAHDTDRFGAYVDALSKGEATVHASTLYPYDILEKLDLQMLPNQYFQLGTPDALLEAQWKSLPNYVEGSHNVLIMADTSGSMWGRPLATSLGLAIYFAERNTGPFKDTFMTFSTKPSLVQLVGDTLYDKIAQIPSIVSDTNLEAAFQVILLTARTHKLKASEMPQALVIISDMEFNAATTCRGNWTLYESLAKQYEAHGYALPNIIFWNVNARHNVFQVSSDHKGVQLASGHSPSVFKSVLTHIDSTPYETMVHTLSDPIYDCITL